MSEKLPYKLKPASQELMKLYTLMGEALSAVQLLEDALCYSIAMKKDLKHSRNIPKSEADSCLRGYRKNTLGDSIRDIINEKLFDDDLMNRLGEIRKDRNWLIHRSLYESLDGSSNKMSFDHCKDFLYVRIKTITNDCRDIQHLISEDLLKFCESMGADMSRAKKGIKEHYG